MDWESNKDQLKQATEKLQKLTGVDSEKRSLSQQVKDLEEAYAKTAGCQCDLIRGTLLLNYGDDGQLIAGVVNNEMDTITMVMDVCMFYHKGLANLPNAEAHGRRSRTVQPLVGSLEGGE